MPDRVIAEQVAGTARKQGLISLRAKLHRRNVVFVFVDALNEKPKPSGVTATLPKCMADHRLVSVNVVDVEPRLIAPIGNRGSFGGAVRCPKRSLSNLVNALCDSTYYGAVRWIEVATVHPDGVSEVPIASSKITPVFLQFIRSILYHLPVPAFVPAVVTKVRRHQQNQKSLALNLSQHPVSVGKVPLIRRRVIYWRDKRRFAVSILRRLACKFVFEEIN